MKYYPVFFGDYKKLRIPSSTNQYNEGFDHSNGVNSNELSFFVEMKEPLLLFLSQVNPSEAQTVVFTVKKIQLKSIQSLKAAESHGKTLTIFQDTSWIFGKKQDG